MYECRKVMGRGCIALVTACRRNNMYSYATKQHGHITRPKRSNMYYLYNYGAVTTNSDVSVISLTLNVASVQSYACKQIIALN